MIKIWFGFSMFLGLLALGALRSAPAAEARGGLTDSIDAGSRAEERAHHFASGGNVTHGIVGDHVGGHDTRRPAHTVAGKGSWIAYRVKVRPEEAVTLEFEELYGRERHVLGYLVLVDNKKVYLRTWQGCGAGPVHYFVQLPPTGKEQVTIKLVNQSDAAFSLGRLWVFCDFARYFDDNRLAVPYYLAPTVGLTFSDHAADLARVRQIKTSLGNHPNVKPAFTSWIPYASLSARDTEDRIDHVLRLADETNLPVQIAFDTWWASTPGGADGKGGYWGDVTYQQVVYNATRKRYQLSVPNQWSNTPWLTVNHPDLNAFKTRRLAESMAHLRRRYRELLAGGKQGLVLALNLDNEPVYWASGNAGLGSELLQADFHPMTVAAARQGGVTLDPADGLSRVERLWLARNLVGYHERIGSAAAAGLERDASVVTPSGAAAHGDLLRGNIYTQAMVADAAIQYPLLDAAYPFWETAAPAAVRVGGEWNGATVSEREAVTHQIALGRNAAVNAEAGNDPSNMQGVRPGYALAQRYYTLYNYPLDKMDVASSEIRDLTQPFPALVYQPVLREDHFRDDGWKGHVAAWGNLQSGLIGNTAAVAVYPAAAGAGPGHLTYRLEAPQGVFEEGLFLQLTGRAFVFRGKNPGVNIRVLVGNGANVAGMREVARFFDTGHIDPADAIDLGAAARGRRVVYVRIEMNAPDLPETVLSWCSVRHVRFTTPWPAAVTQGTMTQDESLGTVRKQNLVVSWRRDAELAIESLARTVGSRRESEPMWRKEPRRSPAARLAAARDAYRQGAYADAYRLANEGLCVLLPATFQVQQGGGWLSPYPVRVDTQQPVTCILREWSLERIRLDLVSDRPAPVSVRIGNLPPGATYTAREEGGEWVVQKADRAAGPALTASEAGEIQRIATARAYPSRPEPAMRSGVFRARVGGRPGSFFLLPEDGSSRALIVTDARTILKRGQPGREAGSAAPADLRYGDQIVARIGSDGVATHVTATYQRVEGTVREFGQLTPFAMPFIVVGEEGKRRLVDLSAPLHTPAGDAIVRARPLGAIDVAPGDTVSLHINPANGRVYELWKPQK